jgi:hypothetical protein
MAIVPAYPGIMRYTRPYWPLTYPLSCYPTCYPIMHSHPAIYQPSSVYPDISCQIYPYRYYETSEYRYTEAINNPGNYFRYPPGQ